MKLIAAWFLLAIVPYSGLAQERVFVTNSRTILGGPEDLTASVTFVDVDGDSDLDVIVANGRRWAQLNEVYLNNGTLRFGGKREFGDPEGPDHRGGDW